MRFFFLSWSLLVANFLWIKQFGSEDIKKNTNNISRRKWIEIIFSFLQILSTNYLHQYLTKIRVYQTFKNSLVNPERFRVNTKGRFRYRIVLLIDISFMVCFIIHKNPATRSERYFYTRGKFINIYWNDYWRNVKEENKTFNMRWITKQLHRSKIFPSKFIISEKIVKID